MAENKVKQIDISKLPFSEKQLQFVVKSTAQFNLAHGSVRSGKTVCTIFRFMHAVYNADQGSQIWIVGHTLETIYRNIVSQIIDSNQRNLSIFRNFCTWFAGKKELRFMDKTIYCIGAKDQGAIGILQGGTCDLCYCDEMTLYPDNVLQMLITRLSNPKSMLFASMNPREPSHKCHELIKLAESGDPKYYALHFTLDDNPYLTQAYKDTLKQTLSGLFYRRHYLGEWCLAEGAIFEFLDRQVHIVRRPPRAAEFWLAGIDYGASNPFCCLLVGYHSGKYGQGGPVLWVEKEYYWDPRKTGRQKTNSEFVRDLEQFLQAYPVRSIYVDPSAESFQLEMKKSGFHVVDAENDVYNGIMQMTNLVKEGTLVICDQCVNLIREMETYSWDPKASAKGEDEPIKQNDHAVDAMRYVVASFLKGRTTLRVPTPEEILEKQAEVQKMHWTKAADVNRLGF